MVLASNVAGTGSDTGSDADMGFETTLWNNISIFASALIISRIVYFFIAGIFFFVSGLVVYNTVTIAVQERMYEMGVLGAIGFTNKQLVKIMSIENLIIISSGSFLGLIFGAIVVVVLQKIGIDMASLKSFGDDAPVSNILYPSFSLFWNSIVIVYALIAVNSVAQLPLGKVAKLEIMKALRSVL